MLYFDRQRAGVVEPIVGFLFAGGATFGAVPAVLSLHGHLKIRNHWEDGCRWYGFVSRRC